MSILSISESILKYVSGFGILQGILLSLLVYFHPKSDRSVNKFLALYIFFLSLVMSMPFIIQAVSWQKSFFQQPLPLITGPLLYLYIRSFKEVITWRKALPHFLFFLLYFIPSYWNVSAMAARYPDAKSVPAELIQHPVTMALNYMKFGQSVLYYFLARRTLASYQRSIKQLFSETSNIDLNWARVLINGFLMIVLSAIVLFSLMIRYPEYFNLFLLLNMAIATTYIYIATYKGVMQPTIWQLKTGADKNKIEEELLEAGVIELQKVNPGKLKVTKPVIAGGKIDELVAKIIVLMEEEKLYQETELTLQDLADKLQIPSYQASQAINEGMNKNFYDLINNYRVDEAKRLLKIPGNRNYTILSVGFEAGFNSKTTFNTVFKKFTGYTPTEYRDKNIVRYEEAESMELAFA